MWLMKLHYLDMDHFNWNIEMKSDVWVNELMHWVYRCLVHLLLGSALHSSQGAGALELIHMPALFFSGISLTDCTLVPCSSIRTTVFSCVWVAQVKQPAQLKDAASAHVLCSSLDKVIQRLHLVQCAKWLWGAKPPPPFSDCSFSRKWFFVPFFFCSISKCSVNFPPSFHNRRESTNWIISCEIPLNESKEWHE